MRSKAVRLTIAVVLIAVAVAAAEWIGGEGVAGTVLLVCGIGLGAHLGVVWGNKEAAKTEEYRREWLLKRASKHRGSPGSTNSDDPAG